MPKSSDIRVRTFHFAIDSVDFCRTVIARDSLLRQAVWQLLRSAGSSGANLEEAAEGQSKAEFIARNYIALKEMRESRYWLRVIAAVQPPSAVQAGPLIAEASELIAMLIAIVKRAKSNPGRGRKPD